MLDILSPPPAKTNIVNAGQPVSFRINLQITGLTAIVSMYDSEPVQVTHHCERVEDGSQFSLGPFPFTTPATVAALKCRLLFRHRAVHYQPEHGRGTIPAQPATTTVCTV